MTADEILADAIDVIGIEPGSVVMHAILVVECMDMATGARYLKSILDDGLPDWCAGGMAADGIATFYEMCEEADL